MTQEAKKILKQALDSMPEVFSSNAFGIELRNLGFSKQETSGGMIQTWLTKNAFKGSSCKMWRKEKFDIPKIEIKPKEENKNLELKFEGAKLNFNHAQMIDILKSNGYRVQKKTETWEDC